MESKNISTKDGNKIGQKKIGFNIWSKDVSTKESNSLKLGLAYEVKLCGWQFEKKKYKQPDRPQSCVQALLHNIKELSCKRSK